MAAEQLVGRLHSIETMACSDGPGIRLAAFFQGCALRCLYCHNRDTWDPHKGLPVTVDWLMAEVERYRHFFEATGGGVTATGGEPTRQAPFVTQWFRECRKEGIHTALDTSGYVDVEEIRPLLDVTDLVLLDIKHIDSGVCRLISGQTNERALGLAQFLAERGKSMWIRWVLVPDWTDNEGDLYRFARWIRTLGPVERVEFLPYHTMGIYKWEHIGVPYPLKGVRAATPEDVERAEAILMEEGVEQLWQSSVR